MNQAKLKQSGFTIMELLMAIAIVGILAGIALPSFNYVIAKNKLSSTANNVVGAFNLARTEAAQRGSRVYVSSASGDTNWASGSRVWFDVNTNGSYDAGEEIRIFEAIDSGLTLTGTRSGIFFNALGFAKAVSGGAVVTGNMTLNLCSNASGVSDRQLGVSASGRININEINCP